jgi:hypothetical protein
MGRLGHGHDVGVADGVDFDGPLQQAKEQQAALSGGTTVEAEDKLVQIGPEVSQLCGG